MLIKACVRANEARMIGRFPAYHRLAEMAVWFTAHPESQRYLSNQYLADLLVWYHLAWLGETVRRGDARVKRLLEKESGYTLHDRRQLLSVIGELLSGVILRYKQLAARGQVELSVTPYAHPIVPLLLDFSCAREAMPQARYLFLEPDSDHDEGADLAPDSHSKLDRMETEPSG